MRAQGIRTLILPLHELPMADLAPSTAITAFAPLAGDGRDAGNRLEFRLRRHPPCQRGGRQHPDPCGNFVRFPPSLFLMLPSNYAFSMLAPFGRRCIWFMAAHRGLLQRHQNRSAGTGSSLNQLDICPRIGEWLSWSRAESVYRLDHHDDDDAHPRLAWYPSDIGDGRPMAMGLDGGCAVNRARRHRAPPPA